MDNNKNNKELSTGLNSSYLKALNKASLKITKPTRKPDPTPLLQTQQQQQQQQPPVYNINKNDFRHVVQKLTGSTSTSTQPTNNNNNATSSSTSRLQRIRPPPLIQITKQNQTFSSFLPPLPSVHHAAESPISAYMRVLHGSDVAVAVADVEKESPISNYMRCLKNSVYSLPQPQAQAQQQMSNQGNLDSLLFPNMPLSPLPFGCVPSPRSQYGFSPTSGMPTVPFHSPR